MARAKTNLESILSRVKATSTGCLEFYGCRTERGYGRVNFEGKMTTAHRAVYILTYGKINTGMLVCHRCDNPPCVNPKHLFAGTQKQNMEDCKTKGRLIMKPKTKRQLESAKECMTKLRESQTRPYKKLTEKQAKRIKIMSGTYQSIAAKFNISPSAVGLIKRGINWSHV